MARRKLACDLRLAARVWSVVSIAFLLLILVSEVLSGEPPVLPTAFEWLGAAFFPVGVVLGLVIACWREGIGGVIGLLGLIGFYLWYLARSGQLLRGPYVALVAAPAALFLLAAFLDDRGDTPRPSPRPRDGAAG